MRLLCLLLIAAGLAAQEPTRNDPTADLGLDQRLDAQLPLDAPFSDAEGNAIRLRDCFHDRPVVLALVYYGCPQLCTLVLNGLVRCLKAVPLDAGRDFHVVVISINPEEGPDLARRKKASYVASYGRDRRADGWHFLTGREEEIRQVADTVGFRYRYDPETRLYYHAAGVMVATPEGRMSRYFYGIEFPPRDVRLGLVEASDGKIGSLTDAVLLFCFHYDPATGKYGFVILNVLRLAGGITVALLAFFVFRTLRRDRRAGAHAGGEAG